MKLTQVWNEKKARKWLWVALGGLVAIQLYFVQELLAALILFTGIFIVGAIIALVLYLIDRAGRWSADVAEQQAKRAVVVVEEFSKKQLRRPRSEPAR